MNRNTILVDLAVAAGLALVALILAPGIAVAGMLAGVLLIVCAVSVRLDSRRARRTPRARRRPR